MRVTKASRELLLGHVGTSRGRSYRPGVPRDGGKSVEEEKEPGRERRKFFVRTLTQLVAKFGGEANSSLATDAPTRWRACLREFRFAAFVTVFGVFVPIFLSA